MAVKNITVSMQQRSDTEINWESVNPILKAGELGFDTTNKKAKFGDGTTAWNDLSYMSDEVLTAINALKEKTEPSNAGTENQVLTKTTDGQEWKDSSGAIISATEPQGKPDAVWINSTTGIIKYWNGTSWDNVYGVFS